jgi:deazaflavin-dependent oxidoreductase (nitroreductase family)
MQLPLFLLRPPAGYGVLTTTGRRTGKTRRRCVRAIKRGDRVYLVAIKGSRTGWLRNVLASPRYGCG